MMLGKCVRLAGLLLVAGILGGQTRPIIPFPPLRPQPRVIETVQPEYPKLAKEAHIEGTVRMAAHVDAQGVVKELRLISGHPLLVKAAMDAAWEWRFAPAMWRGKAVASFTVIEIGFSMARPGRAGPGTIRARTGGGGYPLTPNSARYCRIVLA